MDAERARTLLETERAEVEDMLRQIRSAGGQDHEADQELGDSGDTADARESEGGDSGVGFSLRERLAAVERAEQRLAAGTFGLSVQSGQPIPDERLEVAPTAELTVEEAVPHSWST